MWSNSAFLHNFFFDNQLKEKTILCYSEKNMKVKNAIHPLAPMRLDLEGAWPVRTIGTAFDNWVKTTEDFYAEFSF